MPIGFSEASIRLSVLLASDWQACRYRMKGKLWDVEHDRELLSLKVVRSGDNTSTRPGLELGFF